MLLQPLIDFFSKHFGGEASVETAQALETSVSTAPIGWVMGVGTIGIICIVLFLLCFFWTKERVVQIESEENVSVKYDLRLLLKNTPWWILAGTGLAALRFNAIRDSVAIYYFRDYVQVSYRMAGTGWDMTTIYFLVGQAANLLGVILAPSISAKYGKKRTYAIAILMAGMLSTGFYFIPNNIVYILILQFFTSMFAGYVCRCCGRCLPILSIIRLTTGRRASGLIFSSSSMSQKLGWALGAAMSGWILAMFNYMPDVAQQSAETILGERIMMSLLPAVCCLLAFIGMSFYPLSDKKVKENFELLEKKRAQAGL
jgi:GPH family glycoside/pentoside/hexuronide:cation symporter